MSLHFHSQKTTKPVVFQRMSMLVIQEHRRILSNYKAFQLAGSKWKSNVNPAQIISKRPLTSLTSYLGCVRTKPIGQTLHALCSGSPIETDWRPGGEEGHHKPYSTASKNA